jgi:putative ABC transport system ATP-binding protein
MRNIAVPEAASLALADLLVIFQHRGGAEAVAVRADRLDVPPGTLLGISGPSGSGKTSLLHVLAGLLRPRTGTVRWGDVELVRLGEGARDRWRRSHVGFVFQDFHLIPELSARDNVLLPAWFGQLRAGAVLSARAATLLERMGIPDTGRRAGVLSRGEQQRVAMARALLAGPRILLADEPTASLDGVTAAQMTDLLTAQAREAGATLIVVSHDPALLARMDQVRRMDKGVLLP